MQTATRGWPESGLPIGAGCPLLETPTGPSRSGTKSIVPSAAVASLPSSSVATSSIHSVRGSSVGGTVTIAHQ